MSGSRSESTWSWAIVARRSSTIASFQSLQLAQEIGALLVAHELFAVGRTIVLRKNDLVEWFGSPPYRSTRAVAISSLPDMQRADAAAATGPPVRPEAITLDFPDLARSVGIPNAAYS